jgi:hypothetical protein
MKNKLRNSAVLALIAAAMLPATAAQAQFCGGCYTQPAPLFPYAVLYDQPDLVEVAPYTYAIRPPHHQRDYPYVHCLDGCGRRAPIGEWRRPDHNNRTVINTIEVVRDPPVVIETRRVVDDPPRVIVRRHFVEDEPVRSRRKHAALKQRYIGPDRMNIRLFRKGQTPKSNTRAE